MKPLLILITLLLTASPAAAAPLKIVVSVRPLHSLASYIMDGVATPALLIAGKNSPHTYSLSPSDAVTLQQADIVFLISREFEVGLSKPLKTLAKEAAIVEMEKIPGIKILPLRGADHHEKDGHHHKRHAEDFHLWTDPGHAKQMAQKMAEALIARDPKHAKTYQHNLANLSSALDILDNDLKNLFLKQKPSTKTPYLTYHDTYQYFERRYKIGGNYLTQSPESGAGAKRMQTTADLIRQGKINCVFSEPEFDGRMPEHLMKDAAVKVKTLDPLGSAFADGKDNYIRTMRLIGETIASCL